MEVSDIGTVDTMDTSETMDTTAGTTPDTIDTQTVAETTTVDDEDTTEKSDPAIEKMKRQMAEMQKQLAQSKKDTDFYKKELRKTKSAEEQRTEDERERQEQIQNELETLRKQAAIASNSKKVFSFVGNEEIANNVAEYLMGAADVDGAIDELAKAWREKEKKLKLEYGKIQKPGTSEAEIKQNKAVEFGKQLGKAKMSNTQTDNGLKRFII